MRFFTVGSTVATVLAVSAAVPVALVSAQSPSNCISLRGSTTCPAFEDAFINPSNLTGDFPFFSNVTNVTSFDAQFEQYFNATNQYREQKINIGLQCNRTGSDNVAVQWERTFFCGQFSQRSFDSGCTSGQESPLVVCSDTCSEHSASEQTIVDNPVNCAPTARLYPNHNETRITTIANDNSTCSNWNNLVTTNAATCVSGLANEGNCGFGPFISTQLCAACDPTGNRTIPACCTAQNTTSLSECGSFGHRGAAAVRPYTSTSSTDSMSSTSMPSSSSTDASSTGGFGAANAGNNAATESNGPNLSSGQLAGILVGSIIGAILLGMLLAWLLFGRKRRKDDPESHRMAGGAVYGGAANARSSSGDKGWTHSEDGMSRSLAGSPEADKRHGAGGAALGLGALGAGAAGGAAAAGAAGDRNSPANNRPTSEAMTSSSGADGKGTTVPTVRDQYTGQDIHVGEEVVAIYPYNASLNDEITLEPEQHVTIMRLYDDGWALGRTADGQEGALPLVCVSSTKGDVPGRQGNGTGTSTGTTTGTSDDEGLTSGNEYTSSVDGAVTAEEGATSDARSNRSRGVVPPR